ncbi:hypothetical protein VNO77_17365 [Canavalia gladiata]|uniref:CST complex subunit STN1 n=1 Tax=Canavalia gladiata TaxID=3824 RepID=A0AAN9LMM5_CANGL
MNQELKGELREVMTLQNTHVKLLAFDLLSLTQSQSSSSPLFYRKAIALSRVETLGTVTLRDLKPNRFLRFAVDDGTGCIPCILWLNHLSSPSLARRHPNPADLADAAARFSDLIKVGVVARVRGRITSYKGATQVTVSDVMLERDPNTEILHWLECVHLACNCYNVLPPPSSSELAPPKWEHQDRAEKISTSEASSSSVVVMFISYLHVMIVLMEQCLRDVCILMSSLFAIGLDGFQCSAENSVLLKLGVAKGCPQLCQLGITVMQLFH